MTIMWQYLLNSDNPGGYLQSTCAYNQNNNTISSNYSSQENSVLGLLLKSGSSTHTTPKQTMTSPMTRTVFKQQLQRQQLEQIEQQEKRLSQALQQSTQESTSIPVPANSLPSSSGGLPDVPSSVLQVSLWFFSFCFENVKFVIICIISVIG